MLGTKKSAVDRVGLMGANLLPWLSVTSMLIVRQLFSDRWSGQ